MVSNLAKFDFPSIDEVYYWWLEHPETNKNHICIYKVIGTTFDVKLVSETRISVVATISFTKTNVEVTSKAIFLSVEIIRIIWNVENKQQKLQSIFNIL
jgi:hypothetical protein